MINSSFEPNAASPLLDSLEHTQWFSQTGVPMQSGTFRSVRSWQEAFEYAESEVTGWATVEARNILYSQLSSRDYRRFQSWNDVARALAEPVASVVHRALTTPGTPTFPQPAKDWLNGLLVGALMEESYDDCVRVTLFRDLVSILRVGHFPCGWYCRAAQDFPDRAPIIVY